MYVHDTDSTRPLWKQRGQRFVNSLTEGSARLSHMISEFERALRGTPPAAALALQGRIRAVRGGHDLWHLRPDVYALVKQAYDKWEAQTRLDELEDLFDSSHPRSVPFAL